MVLVKVRDMEIGKKYLVEGIARKLINKELTPGTTRNKQEPQIDLYFKGLRFFEGQLKITKYWDEEYEEVSSGGKRKSRRNQRSKKSRKNHRKTNRRR
jgi:hypothetical protein